MYNSILYPYIYNLHLKLMYCRRTKYCNLENDNGLHSVAHSVRINVLLRTRKAASYPKVPQHCTHFNNIVQLTFSSNVFKEQSVRSRQFNVEF